MHQQVLSAIRREIEAAKAGKKAGIIAKMNALLEPEVIAALYEASKAGVKIDLIVRGVCALHPACPANRITSACARSSDASSSIIASTTSRALDEVYLASADWMDRNFFRRIEVAFPVLDAKLKKRVIEEGLKITWQTPHRPGRCLRTVITSG
jgi:polyphosphate kinase